MMMVVVVGPTEDLQLDIEFEQRLHSVCIHTHKTGTVTVGMQRKSREERCVNLG
jgi:hypothetical protein